MLFTVQKKSIAFIFCCLFFHIVYASFRLGIENIPQSFVNKIKKNNYRVGLITNQTGRSCSGVRTVDVLRAMGINVTTLFAPEHGVDGIIQAGTAVKNAIDHATGIPIVSLYGNGAGKTMSDKMMKNIDMLFFDIQDCGMRHYTYISTLFKILQSAAQYNKHCVVLDRPNPLGALVEGPSVEKRLISFISIAPIPLRHGMTVGEIAWYFNTYCLEKKAHLHVIPMQGYRRIAGIPHEIHAPLSPNIQTVDACFGYSFLGLLGEIKPFDVGVGRPIAFQVILLPTRYNISTKTWNKVQRLLERYNIDAVSHTYFDTKRNEVMSGLRLHCNDIGSIQSFHLFIDLVQLFKQEGVKISFSNMFDKAVGTDKVRIFFKGEITKTALMEDIKQDIMQFIKRSHTFCIYKPYNYYL